MPGLACQLKRTSIKGCKRGERAKTKKPIPKFTVDGIDDAIRGVRQANRRATVSLPMPIKDDIFHSPNPKENTDEIDTVEIRKPRRRASDSITSAPAGGRWKNDSTINMSPLRALPGIDQHLHDPSLYSIPKRHQFQEAMQRDVFGGSSSLVPSAPPSSVMPSYISSPGQFPGQMVPSISDFSTEAESDSGDVDEFCQFIEKSIHFTHE